MLIPHITPSSPHPATVAPSSLRGPTPAHLAAHEVEGWSNLDASVKTSGYMKLSSAYSSCRLFWMGVPGGGARTFGEGAMAAAEAVYRLDARIKKQQSYILLCRIGTQAGDPHAMHGDMLHSPLLQCRA